MLQLKSLNICYLLLTALLLFTGIQEAAAERLLDHRGRAVRYGGNFSAAPVHLPPWSPPAREFRGVWVATVGNIDFAKHTTAAAFRRDYIRMVENLRRMKFNAIIFQVRPMGDAFYPSRLAPWSRWLTGQEGRGLGGGFDPLRFMVTEAHRRGLEFHAWLNPFRVIGSTKLSKAAYLRTLHPANFARRNPWAVLSVREAGANTLFLNPGEPAVCNHLTAVVREIISRYPVDGIHFDDYFYPFSPVGNADRQSYLKYNPARLSLANWRRANVTRAMISVKNTIDQVEKRSGRRISFGVSPFGIWRNRSKLVPGSLTGGKESYTHQYADTRLWVKGRYIDYIIPQLYWPFTHRTAAYAALADWWSNTVRGTGVKLYIGLAIYRLGATPDWGAAEIYNQMRYNRRNPEIRGVALYSYRHLFENRNQTKRRGVSLILDRCWQLPARRP